MAAPARRLSMRTRLTLSYAGLVIGTGAVLITMIYLYMRYLPITIELSPETGGMIFNVQIALLISEFLNRLLIISLLALALMAAASGVVGWILAGRVLTPLATMGASARRAASGDLSHPIAMTGPHDEIRDLADSFDHMLVSLERSLDAHRRFAANASHELRTPLATTQTMIDVALADPETSVEELRGLVMRIREVNRANVETIDALLDLAHAQAGSTVRERVDLREQLAGCLAEAAGPAAERGVELHGPAGGAVALGDPVLLRQAASNLLRNAVRYNRPGGVVDVRLDERAGRALLSVRNDGEPVPAEKLNSLREPFVRGNGRTATRGEGHGLGLAIIQAIAEAHDGELRLTANPEGGLTVVLALPAARDGGQEPAESR